MKIFNCHTMFREKQTLLLRQRRAELLFMLAECFVAMVCVAVGQGVTVVLM